MTRWTATRAIGMLLGFVLAGAISGCASTRERLDTPAITVSPYDPLGGDMLFAVVPLRNESGTTLIDTMAISDDLVAAVQQVEGLRCLPLNRTIAALRVEEMQVVATPADVRLLAERLGVDGIIVGSVTAWDPYQPPVLGLSLALYLRPEALDARLASGIDVRELRYQPTEWSYFPASRFGDQPASSVSLHLDARSHEIQKAITRYAIGRDDSRMPLGWRRYLDSMPMYTRFATHHSIGRLLDHEAVRLSRQRPAGR